MSTLLDELRDCYRKERGHLILRMLALDSLRPHPDVLREICNEIGVDVPTGEVFGAPDFHLDWIEEALHSVSKKTRPTAVRTQRDTDYLIAFDSAEVSHLVLVEAKGDSYWSNRQLMEKSCRWKELFGENRELWPGVVPHLVLMSPQRPQRLCFAHWPTWTKAKIDAGTLEMTQPLHWIRLSMPDRKPACRLPRGKSVDAATDKEPIPIS